MEKSGRVFMLDDDVIILNLYHDLLEAKGYDIFTTNNAYKFLLYAKEMLPDIFILDLNMPEVTGWEVLEMISKDEKLRQVPVLLFTVHSDKELANMKGVAHFLHKPVAVEKLTEVIGAYCSGGKNPDILLINDYNEDGTAIKEAIEEKQLSYFELNDVKFANIYLKKNHPKIVCVRYPKQRYDEMKADIKHDKVFYVENRQNIEELVSFLK